MWPSEEKRRVRGRRGSDPTGPDHTTPSAPTPPAEDVVIGLACDSPGFELETRRGDRALFALRSLGVIEAHHERLGLGFDDDGALVLWVVCPVAAGGPPPLDGLVDVEKMGLPPRGTAGTQIPLCTGATGRPPLPPFWAVETVEEGANAASPSWICESSPARLMVTVVAALAATFWPIPPAQEVGAAALAVFQEASPVIDDDERVGPRGLVHGHRVDARPGNRVTEQRAAFEHLQGASPPGANCMEAPSPFLLASLVPADAGDVLRRGASEMRCAPVELDHWLINKREAQRSFDMVASRPEAGPFVLSTKVRPRGSGQGAASSNRTLTVNRPAPRRTTRARPGERPWNVAPRVSAHGKRRAVRRYPEVSRQIVLHDQASETPF